MSHRAGGRQYQVSGLHGLKSAVELRVGLGVGKLKVTECPRVGLEVRGPAILVLVCAVSLVPGPAELSDWACIATTPDGLDTLKCGPGFRGLGPGPQ